MIKIICKIRLFLLRIRYYIFSWFTNEISTGANGSPLSVVCASLTLCSAPIHTSWNFLDHMSWRRAKYFDKCSDRLQGVGWWSLVGKVVVLLTSILAYQHTCILLYLHAWILQYLHTSILVYSHTRILAYSHTRAH